jgi:8-oxo-dGTP diphosphatase
VLDRSSTKRAPYTVDVVLLSLRQERLCFLAQHTSDNTERWTLPWHAPSAKDPLDESALRLVGKAIAQPPAWMEQIGAFGGGLSHPADTEISVAYVGAVAGGTESNVESPYGWIPVESASQLPVRQQAMIEGGLERVQSRLDQSPVAFRFLPAVFTLSELQHTYELLLGKRLHKASFRRALQAAWLVEPMEEWRSEGRGRPAQLYQYAPRRRRRGRRGVRFDFLTV